MLVILDDDEFRRSLIRTLDQKHFSVTFFVDGEEVLRLLEEKSHQFKVVLLGLDLKDGKGLKALEYLRDNRTKVTCGIIIIGEPNPEIRTYAPWADETLLKPVDPEYIALRARTYCNC
ncbi:MAG TPA: response regulator [Thermoanaerobaculia bacterium]|nr:response regulator [Thermoanaerobaculia bacterium]